MAHGKPKGKIDPAFQARVDDLEDKARKIADQFKTYSGFREWHTPKDVKDPLDVPSIHNPTWNRNSINQLYSNDILAGEGTSGGTVGDLIAMKWQADFMAVEERAFRTRHATLARCAAIAHGRLDGHGQKGESVFSFLKDAIKAHIAAGAKGGPE